MPTAFSPAKGKLLTARPAIPPGRPSETRYFADESSPGQRDGTIVDQVWFNSVSAVLRRAITDAGIALNDADETMLSSAITALAIGAAAAGYLPLAGGTLTGPLELAADPAADAEAANKHYVDNALAALVASAPAALDTLKELADALGDDPNFAATITAALAAKAPLASPALTGSPTAPTPAVGDNSTKLANTAFVAAAIAAVSAGIWAPGSLNGLTLSSASATTIVIAPGGCRNEDAGSARNMTLPSGITKSLSIWTPGSGNGGLDTGSIAANTWYAVHLIRKDSDGSLDVLLSLSPSTPTMPAGYTARRRIGVIRTNASSQVTPFVQNGDDFWWSTPVADVNSVNPGTAAITVTTSVPTGLVVTGIYAHAAFGGTNAGIGVYTSALNTPDIAPQDSGTSSLAGPINGFGSGSGSGAWLMSVIRVPTNTAAQIRMRMSRSGSADRLGLVTFGWNDTRGKL